MNNKIEYGEYPKGNREHTANTPKNLSEAIERAVDECIEEGVLADILSNHKAEVLELALTTFDRELYEQGLREEGEAIGEARGEGKKLLESVANLQKNLHLSLEDALGAIGATITDYEKARSY